MSSDNKIGVGVKIDDSPPASPDKPDKNKVCLARLDGVCVEEGIKIARVVVVDEGELPLERGRVQFISNKYDRT